MIIVAFILWGLVWGLVGYFSVRAMLARIERERVAKAIAARSMMPGCNLKPVVDEDGKMVYSLFPDFNEGWFE